MAKGVEDTAFYRWLRLTALNEVGGDPDRFTLPVDEFHRANLEREARFPNHLLATPDARHQAERRRPRADRRAGRAGRRVGRGGARLAPARRPERGLPALADARRRLADRARAARGVHAEGAARGEAQHELDRAGRGARGAACARRSHGVYADLPPDFEPFAARVAAEGRRISLGMTLLKLTAPGRARHLPGRRARVR